MIDNTPTDGSIIETIFTAKFNKEDELYKEHDKIVNFNMVTEEGAKDIYNSKDDNCKDYYGKTCDVSIEGNKVTFTVSGIVTETYKPRTKAVLIDSFKKSFGDKANCQ